MKKITCALVLTVFCSSCLLCWSMLALMLQVRGAPRALPYFTNLCINFRPLLIALPLMVAAGYLWMWFRKEERVSRWMGLVVVAMAVMIIFVLPAVATSYLLMIAPVKLHFGLP